MSRPQPDAREDVDREIVDEGHLVAQIARGDAQALRALMTRYDRLVRFTVFRLSRDRCLHDPQWLDGLASEVWTAFVQRAKQIPQAIPSPRTFLYSIARNRTVSALRDAVRDRTRGANSDSTGDAIEIPDSEAQDPTAEMARVEELSALFRCRDALSSDDRRMLTQLEAILERRWEAAAGALGIPESTLRSRWKGIVGQLRECLEGKIGRPFAPSGPPGD